MALTRKWVMKCFDCVILHSKAGQWGVFFITMLFTTQTHVVLLVITKLAKHVNGYLSGWARQVKPVKSFCIESLSQHTTDNACIWSVYGMCVYPIMKEWYIHTVPCKSLLFKVKSLSVKHASIIHLCIIKYKIMIYTYHTTGCKIQSFFVCLN